MQASPSDLEETVSVTGLKSHTQDLGRHTNERENYDSAESSAPPSVLTTRLQSGERFQTSPGGA